MECFQGNFCLRKPAPRSHIIVAIADGTSAVAGRNSTHSHHCPVFADIAMSAPSHAFHPSQPPTRTCTMVSNVFAVLLARRDSFFCIQKSDSRDLRRTIVPSKSTMTHTQIAYDEYMAPIGTGGCVSPSAASSARCRNRKLVCCAGSHACSVRGLK